MTIKTDRSKKTSGLETKDFKMDISKKTSGLEVKDFKTVEDFSLFYKKTYGLDIKDFKTVKALTRDNINNFFINPLLKDSFTSACPCCMNIVLGTNFGICLICYQKLNKLKGYDCLKVIQERRKNYIEKLEKNENRCLTVKEINNLLPQIELFFKENSHHIEFKPFLENFIEFLITKTPKAKKINRKIERLNVSLKEAKIKTKKLEINIQKLKESTSLTTFKLENL